MLVASVRIDKAVFLYAGSQCVRIDKPLFLYAGSQCTH